MKKEMKELELDELEKKGINRYKAVLMAAQEARFINEQVRLGIVKPEEKPTSMKPPNWKHNGGGRPQSCSRHFGWHRCL
jgi:hypothetical protein